MNYELLMNFGQQLLFSKNQSINKFKDNIYLTKDK